MLTTFKALFMPVLHHVHLLVIEVHPLSTSFTRWRSSDWHLVILLGCFQLKKGLLNITNVLHVKIITGN